MADTSWIRPGAVAWSWLTEHSSPSDQNRQRQYIDFAQRNGWGYVLIDEGWSSGWAPDVIAYARARNVQVEAVRRPFAPYAPRRFADVSPWRRGAGRTGPTGRWASCRS
ncbi:hypothetical protein GCM10022252_26500 [Streptosporangium oxazolinicum]|uniref:Uncharacterized protein n=1 Tax=Streptosporangium oxazolinicum TaxID=909287 RepID=A0ABP8ASN3_9ACTN